jgi:predicted 3-demethylubiquinone-9 3-methyltransferase (glyoxalase superfamily)
MGSGGARRPAAATPKEVAMEKIVPFLWFDDQAEEAANFYVSVFSKRPGAGTSRVRNITHYGEAGPRPTGMVMTVDFELEGHAITALNGGPEFSFTEAISLAVNCESQQEVDYLWTALSEGGEEGPCGWLKDRYGLSWQIMPVRLTELLNDPDEAAAQRVMAAMLQMTKIDIAELERAYAAGT